MRYVSLALLTIATPALAQPAPPPGAPVAPNAGALTGSGSFTTRDGQPLGTWTVTATLAAGKFTGSGTIVLNGTRVTLPLVPAKSYLENGKCYFTLEEARTRLNFGGPCTTRGVAGTMTGFVPQGEIYSITGYATGTLAFGSPAANRAPAAPNGGGVLPTQKLTCAYMERIGGNVAGDLARYELRFSNMVTLTLNAAGTYRTNATAGRFVRAGGDRIRLVGGQFDGAVGRLQPDKSGTPAVYFELDENRRANGTPIVDVYRTSCTVAR